MYGPRALLEDIRPLEDDDCWPDTVAAHLEEESPSSFHSSLHSPPLAPATPVPPSAWSVELPPSFQANFHAGLQASLQAKNPPSAPPRPSLPPSLPPAPVIPPSPAPRPQKSEAPSSTTKKITIRTIRRMKEQGEKICMLTAYDAVFGRLVDQAGAEMILVGDSLGMVVQGADHTLAVTLNDMIYHTRCVARVAQRAMIVGDMPFMSYQISPVQALESAGRLIKEGGAHAVKLEGGAEIVDAVSLITRAGIPVVGHLGLTPQSLHAMGGFVVQGRDPLRADQIRRDALALQAAGVFCLVLEGIPASLASEISKALSIPTIGIGAGVGCDGQVLVIYDLLGLSGDFKPRFVKRFADLTTSVHAALASFCREVKEGSFPQDEHSFF